MKIFWKNNFEKCDREGLIDKLIIGSEVLGDIFYLKFVIYLIVMKVEKIIY